MNSLSIALATFVIGIGLAVSGAEAGPGGSAGYPYDDASAQGKISILPGHHHHRLIRAGWDGNDGTVCRNLDLACTGGHGPIGWFCSCPEFTGTWSAW